MKRTSIPKRILSAITLGVINTIRKEAIHIRPEGKTAKRAWNEFLEKHGPGDRHQRDLKWLFGNLLDDWG